MTKNVGGFDRLVRIVLGVGLVSLFFVDIGNWRYIGLVVGIVSLFTALTQSCMINKLLGRNTCSLRTK